MNRNLAMLAERGQAVWIDHIRREMFGGGALRALIEEGVVGLTSNPTIFQKAISEGDEYSDAFEQLARAGKSREEIYDALVLEDIRAAAEIMQSVYRKTDRRDGYVSIEINPNLAYDARASLAEGRRLFAAVGKPNVMVKVPGTAQGLPVIEDLLAEGVNVNVTLIFSVAVYRQVMDAYLRGLKRFADSGGDPATLSSVASFFVSRIDTAVDKQLENRLDGGTAHLKPLLGQAAIANAKMAYQAFREVFDCRAGGFAELTSRGGRVQRPLWASTSTKNPRYRDTHYVDTLVGPDTVNTMPPATLDAVRRNLEIRGSLSDGLDEARSVIEKLADAGIELDAVTEMLRTEGVRAFSDSFNALMENIEDKRTLQENAIS